MKWLIIYTFIGFLAQLIDGSLGMAYGVTSATLLLYLGVSPAITSASVHLSEIVTTAVSGTAHIKFGNVDKNTVYRLIIPGSIGAFIGATFLSSLPGNLIKPYVSLFLLILGVYVLIRFLFIYKVNDEKNESVLPIKKSIPLGLFAGFFDAIGGGGWGPITTPVLLAKKGSNPRKVVGTVDTSEFVVAVSASVGFFISLGWESVNWSLVITFMLGGAAAAPIAAWLVRIIPSQLMRIFVAGIIILTNIRTLTSTFTNNLLLLSILYSVIIVLWILAILYTLFKLKKIRRIEQNIN